MSLPGPSSAPDLIAADSYSFICGIIFDYKKQKIGISCADLTTGEFELSELKIDGTWGALLELVLLYRPLEILTPSVVREKEEPLYNALITQLKQISTTQGRKPHLDQLDPYVFELKTARRLLQEHFSVTNLAGFGITGLTLGISAAGAVLHYLKDTQKDSLHHFVTIKQIRNSDQNVTG